jgi:hypothetical protein
MLAAAGIFTAVAIIVSLFVVGIVGKGVGAVIAVMIPVVALVLGLLYYVFLTYARAQEIGLAAVQGREPDFTKIRIGQHILYLLILGLPLLVIGVILVALHIKDLSVIFSIADISIFYMVPMASIATGSALGGIEQSFKLFRQYPWYVILCGGVAALVLYAIGTLPIELSQYLITTSPTSKMIPALINIAAAITTSIVAIRYEPFYRAQVYQSVTAPTETEETIALSAQNIE